MRVYLIAASIRPIVRLTFPQANVIPCLATVPNHPAAKHIPRLVKKGTWFGYRAESCVQTG